MVFRTTINFGSLPAAGTKSVPHNISDINTSWRITDIYGGATNPNILEGIPLPYVSAGATNNDNLEVWVDSTNINVKTGGKDYSAYLAELVIEYTKYL